MKTIRLILTFYKGFAASGLSITALCLVVYYVWKASVMILVPLFWFKVASDVLIWYYIKQSKRKQFYYYHALGISKPVLWTGALSLDFCIYVISMIITAKFCHA